ncbi:hypothetical protein EV424DRAFT_1620499 [Suillus variegatus]|nr:hypothetical protein EV424DRAFT_1620499 [Suillus variegatus]
MDGSWLNFEVRPAGGHEATHVKVYYLHMVMNHGLNRTFGPVLCGSVRGSLTSQNRTENQFSVLGHLEQFHSGLGHPNHSEPSTLPSFTSMLPLAFFKATMILHMLFAVTDLLGDQYSVVCRCVLPALCTKQGRDDETDTFEITFYNDPDDDVPLPPVPSNGPDDDVPSTEPKKNAFSVLLKTGHTPATVTAGSRCSGRPSKPSARICDAGLARLAMCLPLADGSWCGLNLMMMLPTTMPEGSTPTD